MDLELYKTTEVAERILSEKYNKYVRILLSTEDDTISVELLNTDVEKDRLFEKQVLDDCLSILQENGYKYERHAHFEGPVYISSYDGGELHNSNTKNCYTLYPNID